MRFKPLSRGLLGAVLLAGATVFTSACTDLGVGRKCLPPGDVSAVQISTPALECMSRLCYLQGDENGTVTRSVCTARCTTDEDCKDGLVGNEPGLCGSSFVCGVATSVGGAENNLSCEGICICKDDLKFKDSTSGNACCPTGCEGKCPASLPKC